jgi:tartrate-resistant acid phosphatase type 5
MPAKHQRTPRVLRSKSSSALIAALLALLAALTYLVAAAQPQRPIATPAPAAQPTSVSFLPFARSAAALPPNTELDVARFAVIGDYGLAGPNERAVADLVETWTPDFVVTTGDNNYPDGKATTIDENIGQYYHEFIAPYTGSYGAGAETNRFYPSLGNHDWHPRGAQPYLDYFTLPGNERYYDVARGPVHLFAIDSDPSEPDGVTSDSTQGQWLQGALAASSGCWDLVFFHHPAFSSGQHGSTSEMQWPFQAWGADAVLNGHDHLYERLLVDGFPYFVDGLGGAEIYQFQTPVPGSQVRYNATFGAMLVVATRTTITYQFIAIDGTVVDTYTQSGGCQP